MLVSYSENLHVGTVLSLELEAFIIHNHGYSRDRNLTQRPNDYLVIDFHPSVIQSAASPQIRQVAPL